METNKNGIGLLVAFALLGLTACSHEKIKTKAKESAAKYWLERAYPGKGYDVQVVSAEEADDGVYKVKGVVDGETREGTYDPNKDSFSEGFYPMAKEKSRRIAELEEQLKYWKLKAADLEKENFKLKVKLGVDEDSKKKENPEKSE